MTKTYGPATVIVAAVALCAAVTSGQPIHVDDDAALLGDGSGWATAYRYLRDALAAATPPAEIRIAQGRYTPDLDEAGVATPLNRFELFELVSGVALKGGYRGCPGGDCAGADDRDVLMPSLGVWPGFDPLRSDPRFQTLLRRMNFPETATPG